MRRKLFAFAIIFIIVAIVSSIAFRGLALSAEENDDVYIVPALCTR